MWFNKNNQLALYVDKYPRVGVLCDNRNFEVMPDQVEDFTNLSFPDETFYHVVFDPPHLTSIGENSWMAEKYGKLFGDWETQIRAGFDECMRVLKPFGTLVFKWSEHDITTKRVLECIEREPLYGNRINKGPGTTGAVWLVFLKSQGEFL
jgi:hypothetical protein